MEQLIIVAILISLGYFFGKNAENRHYKSILEREKKWLRQPTTSNKRVFGDSIVEKSHLVTGNVVISIDYFKRILAG